MSVIKALNWCSGRTQFDFSEELRDYRFNKINGGTIVYTCFDSNKLSNDYLSKNSSIIYKQNFNSLLTFLPYELVEKILNYETYSFPMINVYKEMIMFSTPYRLDINVMTNQRYIHDQEYRDLKSILWKFIKKKRFLIGNKVDEVINCFKDIDSSIKGYNIPSLFNQTTHSKKDVDGLILYIIRKENRSMMAIGEGKYEYIYHYEDETDLSILLGLKKCILFEWQFFSELLYKIAITGYNTKHIFHHNNNYETMRIDIIKDKFDRYLDWDIKQTKTLEFYGKYGISVYEFNNNTKDDIMDWIQRDFDNNKIPIKLKKSWTKKKMIRLYLQEGREIFFNEHKKKFKKVLNQYIRKIIHKFVYITAEEEQQHFQPQTRLGECAGCFSICEECERLLK